MICRELKTDDGMLFIIRYRGYLDDVLYLRLELIARNKSNAFVLVGENDQTLTAGESEHVAHRLRDHYLPALIDRDRSPDIFSFGSRGYGTYVFSCLSPDKAVHRYAVYLGEKKAFFYIGNRCPAFPFGICLSGDAYLSRYLLLGETMQIPEHEQIVFQHIDSYKKSNSFKLFAVLK